MQNNNTANHQEKDTETFRLQDLLRSYIKYWPWFIISTIIVVSISFVVLRKTSPVYQSQASVLVTTNDNSAFGANMSIFNDMNISSNGKEFFNEIEILKSRSLIRSIINELDLCNSIYLEGSMMESDKLLYHTSPLDIEFLRSEDKEERTVSYTISMNDENSFELREEYVLHGKKIIKEHGNHTLKENISTSNGKLKVVKNNLWEDEFSDASFRFVHHPIDTKITHIQDVLNIGTINKDASVLKITITGVNKNLNNDIINELIEQHEINAINEKNQITRNTSMFIDERMEVIEKELNEVETQGETFKSEKQIINIEKDAEVFLSKEESLSKALLESNIQLKLAEYMLEFMNDNSNEAELLPVNLGIENKGMSDMLSEYNKLVLEKNMLLKNSSMKNPAVIKLQDQINAMRLSIHDGLKNSCESLKLKVASLEKEAQEIDSRLTDLPEYEKEFRGIMRQQEIKETLYIYLLQKREENQIAMVSTIGSFKIIDEAFALPHPIKPKKKIIYLGAFLLGLCIPFGLIYIKNSLDTKVNGTEDLENMNLPIAGILPVSKEKTHLLDKGNHLQITDSFQALGTNINFLLSASSKNEEIAKTVFVTSTIPSEGKSFVSLNLANNLTLNNKKVLLIGLDLRAPRVAEYIESNATVGVSDYIINKSIQLDNIIHTSKQNENLSYIVSGIIPPNPIEILMNPRLEEMFAEIKKQFDFIIVDTPPMALVVDTLSIVQEADMILYVVREGYLDKKLLSIPHKMMNDERVNNLVTVLNYSRQNMGNNNSYGYGYGYGYTDQNTNSILKRLLKKYRK